MKVSAIVLTFNEEINIDRCLASLAWCDDIIVIDSGSTDRTLELSIQHGARVLSNPFQNFSQQRNWALDNGRPRHEWILHLDADEAVPGELATALSDLEPPAGIFGYRIPSKTIMFGRWLKRSGMYPTFQVRLGHREKCRFYEHGHGQRELLPALHVGWLMHPYDHHAFSHGLAKWLIKHVGYAKAEAAVILDGVAPRVNEERKGGSSMARRRAMKHAANRLPPLFRPIAKAFYMGIIRGGILDGAAGLTYCAMHAAYETMIAILLIEGRSARRGQRP